MKRLQTANRCVRDCSHRTDENRVLAIPIELQLKILGSLFEHHDAESLLHFSRASPYHMNSVKLFLNTVIATNMFNIAKYFNLITKCSEQIKSIIQQEALLRQPAEYSHPTHVHADLYIYKQSAQQQKEPKRGIPGSEAMYIPLLDIYVDRDLRWKVIGDNDTELSRSFQNIPTGNQLRSHFLQQLDKSAAALTDIQQEIPLETIMAFLKLYRDLKAKQISLQPGYIFLIRLKLSYPSLPAKRQTQLNARPTNIQKSIMLFDSHTLISKKDQKGKNGTIFDQVVASRLENPSILSDHSSGDTHVLGKDVTQAFLHALEYPLMADSNVRLD